MTKTQKEIKTIEAKLATMRLAKEATTDEAYFYELIDAIREAELDLEMLTTRRSRVDSNTQALVSANID
jgi:hypothetical protein